MSGAKPNSDDISKNFVPFIKVGANALKVTAYTLA